MLKNDKDTQKKTKVDTKTWKPLRLCCHLLVCGGTSPLGFITERAFQSSTSCHSGSFMPLMYRCVNVRLLLEVNVDVLSFSEAVDARDHGSGCSHGGGGCRGGQRVEPEPRGPE